MVCDNSPGKNVKSGKERNNDHASGFQGAFYNS